MLIYAGKEISAAVAGGTLEAVVCEKCATAYYYELTRIGTGSAASPYFLFQCAAAGRAEARAERDLHRRLAADAELVPCPACHWVNASLVDRYRQRRYRRVWWLIGAALLLSPFVGALFTTFAAQGTRASWPIYLTPATVLGAVLLSAFALRVRRQLRLRIDPNRTHPRRPTLPPGTPPALVERVDAATGRPSLQPAAPPQVVADDGRSDAAALTSKWATLRAGQLHFPRQCVVCMAKARTIYMTPFQANQNSDLTVPLCEACASRLLAKWWLTAAATIATAAGAAALITNAVGGDAFGRWFLFGVIVIFAGAFGVALAPAAVCRPYRMRTVDADRGVVQFAAKNPLYTALMSAAAHAADAGRPAPPKRPQRTPPPDASPLPLD